MARLAESAGAGSRRWSPPVLLGVLCAGLLGPLLGGVGAASLTTAGIGALTAVGGNVLTDVLKSVVERLRPRGEEVAREDVEGELERQIQGVLAAGGERAALLRADIAGVLREVGAVGVALEAAAQTGDRELQARLAAGFMELGAEFSEFAFLLSDMRTALVTIQEELDQQGAAQQVIVDLLYRQSTEVRLVRESMWAIERQARTDSQPLAAWTDGAPYRGLVPFAENHAEVFYGREIVIAELVGVLSRHLAGDGLVMVTGASGAGKSSLVHAGLLPALARGSLSGSSASWPRRVITPGGAPLSRLATQLAVLAGLDAREVLRSLTDHPQDAHLLVRQAVQAEAERQGRRDPGRLVLVVDQFEQVFTTGDLLEEWQFVTALHSAASGPGEAPPAIVVIVVRGDFIDRCAQHAPLAVALQSSQFVVGPMAEPDLRRAITGPADAAGLEIEPGLTDAILSELRSATGGYGTGILPLLSQAMLTTWEQREGTRLTSRGYALTGGVRHAVATSAEGAYAALTESQRVLARQLFHRLTTVSYEVRPARRTVARADLLVEEQVVESFARRRLIVVGRDTAEIAHDTLLTAWPRLGEWLTEDLAEHVLLSQVVDDAAEWARSGRDPSFLYQGTRLAEVRAARPRWQADPERYPALTADARAFLEAGDKLAARGTRRRRLVIAALSGLLVLALAAAGLAARSAGEADRQRELAVGGQRLATARLLAAQAESLRPSDPRTSIMLGIAAHTLHPDSETRSSLTGTLSSTRYLDVLEHKSWVTSAAFSPDGRVLATGFGDLGTGPAGVVLWDVTDRLHPRKIGVPLTGHESAVNSVTFSPDGRTLATGSVDQTVMLWDITDVGRPLPIYAPLTSTKGLVNFVEFSPDGRTLATAALDQGILLWDVTDPKRSRRKGDPLTGPGKVTAAGAAFSHDGRFLAASRSDGAVMLWDLRHPERPRQVVLPGASVISLAFSPDGRTLAVSRYNSTASLWDLTDPAHPAQLGESFASQGGLVTSLTFSPDGRTLAADGPGNAVVLRDVTDRARPRAIGQPLTGHRGLLASMAFSPDGRTLVTGSVDGSAILWDAYGDARPHPLDPPVTNRPGGDDSDGTGKLRAAAFSPDGRILATGDGDQVLLWDTTGQHRQLGPALGGHTQEVKTVEFSTDGRILATASLTRVILWDMTDPLHPTQLGSPITRDPGLANFVTFSPDTRTLLTGSGHQEIRAWDLTDRAHPRKIDSPFPALTTVEAVYSPDGRTLAVFGPLASVTLWDTAQPPHQIWQSPPEENVVGPVAFSPDGRILATSSEDNRIMLWNVTDRTRPSRIGDPLDAHRDYVNSLTFSADGAVLVSSSDDHTVILWDLTNPARPRRMGDPVADPHIPTVTSVVLSPDMRQMALNGWDLAASPWNHAVTLWDLSSFNKIRTHPVQRACVITGGGPTAQEWARYVPDLRFQNGCAGQS